MAPTRKLPGKREGDWTTYRREGNKRPSGLWGTEGGESPAVLEGSTRKREYEALEHAGKAINLMRRRKERQADVIGHREKKIDATRVERPIREEGKSTAMTKLQNGQHPGNWIRIRSAWKTAGNRWKSVEGVLMIGFKTL